MDCSPWSALGRANRNALFFAEMVFGRNQGHGVLLLNESQRATGSHIPTSFRAAASVPFPRCKGAGWAMCLLAGISYFDMEDKIRQQRLPPAPHPLCPVPASHPINKCAAPVGIAYTSHSCSLGTARHAEPVLSQRWG